MNPESQVTAKPQVSTVRHARADQIHFSQGNIRHAEARHIDMRQGGIVVAVSENVTVSEGGIAVAFADTVKMDGSSISVAVARQISGDATVAFDARAALLFGITAGVVIWLLNRLLTLAKRSSTI